MYEAPEALRRCSDVEAWRHGGLEACCKAPKSGDMSSGALEASYRRADLEAWRYLIHCQRILELGYPH